MTTTVNINSFVGPNEGGVNGYLPHTEIDSHPVNDDMTKIMNDLDYHVSLFQTAFTKLDQIDLAEIGYLDASMIIDAMNASTLKIPIADLDPTIASLAAVANLIDAHRLAIAYSTMHPQITIRDTELTHSFTPTNILQTCVNLLDELKNIRCQIGRMNGKTTWVDTPDNTLAGLNTAFAGLNNTVTAHNNDGALHLSVNQNAALDAATSPSGSNPLATINDISAKGIGNMVKSTYDTNNDGVVDKSAALVNGAGIKTYADIMNDVTTAIQLYESTHPITIYSSAQAIAAINSDADHSITAPHYYNDLLGKPAAKPADAFLTAEVTNIRTNKLANGTTPWTGYVALNSANVVRASVLPDVMVMPTTWLEHVRNEKYFGSNEDYVTATITGPAMILGGTAVCTVSNGYIMVSVDAGAHWANVITTPGMFSGPGTGSGGTGSDNLNVWTCPTMYVPAGRSFRIKAGSCACVSGTHYYGGGFHIQYRSINAE